LAGLSFPATHAAGKKIIIKKKKKEREKEGEREVVLE
jgi:hypothetical protein